MEGTEVFLFTFLVSHYIFNVLFISWLLVVGEPTLVPMDPGTLN